MTQKMGRQSTAWSPAENVRLQELHGTMTIAEVAAVLGRTRGSIRGQITALGIAKRLLWTPEEEAQLRELYAAAGRDGVLKLGEFAQRLGRGKANVCRKAVSLGLETNKNRKLVEQRKNRRKYATDEELRAAISARAKLMIAERGHPRGMLGKKHSTETRLRLSAASKAYNLFLTSEERSERATKAMKAKIAKYGKLNISETKRGKWAAGWREIGGKRNFYRSRWEANYARYLQWLKDNGHIAEWQHEPETFWFEEIKRGTRSYLPDFRVWENNGSSALHEVKGWMDQRSRTTLSRMKKYHPNERIVLIDGAQYRSIRLKVMSLVPGWEDSPRDTHA